MAQTRQLVVQPLRRPELAALLPEWRALHQRFPGLSPFGDPDLQVVWCDRFVPPGQELVLAVRRATSGELVAVLPFFATFGGRLGRLVRYLRPFGGHHEALINEMPEISADPAYLRPALAAVTGWLGEHDDWDFVEFSLRDDQPWMEPRWLVDAGLGSGILVHKRAYPSIVLDLPAGGQLPTLKRNLKESLRRSRNRTAQHEGKWTVERSTPQDDDWQQALNELVRLHVARSRMAASAPAHVDLFTGTSQVAYLEAMAAAGGAARPVIYRLLRDDESAAALLTFEYPGRVWISASGIDPEYWRLGAVTALQWQAVQHAAAEGIGSVTFSVGIDTAKLRWSESVRVRNGFVLVHSRKRSRRLFQLWWVAFQHRRTRGDAVDPYTSTVTSARAAGASAGPDQPG